MSSHPGKTDAEMYDVAWECPQNSVEHKSAAAWDMRYAHLIIVC